MKIHIDQPVDSKTFCGIDYTKKLYTIALPMSKLIARVPFPHNVCRSCMEAVVTISKAPDTTPITRVQALAAIERFNEWQVKQLK